MRLPSGTTLILTGGRAAQWVYQALATDPAFLALSGVRFLFGDERAKRIVVLAYGSEKSALYAQAQTDCANIDAFPARLVRHGEWLITTDRNALQTQARDIIVNTLRAEPSAPRI